MKHIFYPLTQSLIVACLAIFLLTRITGGTIGWYIHNRFIYLTILAVVCLVSMAFLSIRRLIKRPPGDEVGGVGKISELIILSIPLFLGLLIPARPLSSAALETRGIGFSAPGSLPGSGLTTTMVVTPDTWNILDWLQAFNSESRIASLVGQEANVIGFVIFDQQLDENQFMIGRFVITCCVADAFPIAMVVQWPETASLEEDAWVQVKGPVEMISYNGEDIPMIRAISVDIVSAPDQPYLYP
jgi:putative membrane protein